MNKIKYQTVKGMRDFYPENWADIEYLKNIFLDTGRIFGYQEYESPIVENITLYLEKSSQELVEKQSFIVNDRNNEKLILRPELTPSLARMIVAKENELNFPLRWQSWGRFWRYEKPQRGRGREFFQWNIDLIGIDSSQADAEILQIAALSLKNLGLNQNEFQIRLNDREALLQLFQQQLQLSINQSKLLLRALDKIDKIEPKTYQSWLFELGFTQIQIDNFLKLIDNPPEDFSPRLKQILTFIPKNLRNFFTIDLKIVRGLDYYTNLVFEAWATKSTLKRALFGGGRYNNLTQQVGGQKTLPGVGFAIGDMAIFEILKDLNKIPDINPNPSKIFISTFSADNYIEAQNLANFLRKNKINSILNPDPNLKLSQQFKYASKNNFIYVAVLGPEEIKKKIITLKNLQRGKQKSFTQDDLLTILC